MKQIIAWALIGFALALLPANALIVVGLAAAALVFAAGIMATGIMVGAFVRGLKNGD